MVLEENDDGVEMFVPPDSEYEIGEYLYRPEIDHLNILREKWYVSKERHDQIVYYSEVNRLAHILEETR